MYVKLLGEKDRVAFPVSTSRNGLRRMNQYNTGSMTIGLTNRGKVSSWSSIYEKNSNEEECQKGTFYPLMQGLRI